MGCIDQFLDAQMWYLRYCGVLRARSTVGAVRLNVCFAVLVIFIGLQSVYIFQHVAHFAMICDAIPTLVVGMVTLSKFYIFVFHPATIFSLIDSFKRLQGRATADELVRFRRSSQFHATLTKIYMISALIVGWFYILSAVRAGITETLADGRLRFVAPMAFPHNYQHPLVYAITFLFNCDSIHMSIFISGSVDTCFSELATNVTVHFRIIQDRFRSLDFRQPPVAGELDRLVAYHADVLQLCLGMTGLFQYTVFYLLLLDSVLLCVIGYQFVLFMSTPRALMLLAMAFVMVLQAVIYCYHGSMMHEESLRVADAIYQSNWYEAGATVQKRLLLCMVRAQKPVVTKGGFIKATLPTLKKILNSTGSYITMLLSFDTELHPWGQGQRDEYPSKALANFLYSSNFRTKEMDDVLVEECNNRNTVYVLNSSYCYGNLDMIELFGSPAGRALTVNNKTATEMSYGGRPVGGCGRTTGDDPNQLQPASSIISPAKIGHVRISSIDGSIAGRPFVESSGDFIRFATDKRPSPGNNNTSLGGRCSGKSGTTHTDQPGRRNNLKMAKFWKLFDEDRLRKTNLAEPPSNDAPNRQSSRWGAAGTFALAEADDKSSGDLYTEAAHLLGIKCSLTDSCRCIDCQSQYFDCDDDGDAYSEYSDKSYDVEDNLYANRAYYNDDAPPVSGGPDPDAFGSTAAINDHSPDRLPWDEPDARDFNGNECQHYLHTIHHHHPSSLNLSSADGTGSPGGSGLDGRCDAELEEPTEGTVA